TWQVGDQPARSESYTYHSTDGSLKRMVTGMGETIQYTYDALKRPSAQTGSKITRKFTYVDLSSTRTTAQIKDLTYDYGGTQNARSYHYTYDGNGNLSGIQINGTETASYVYDSSGQLTEENLPEQGLRYEYTYDAFGNITQVEAWEEDESTPFLSRTYTYGNSQWLDQLTGWDNHTISYDEAGNPLNWYSGEKDWSLSWEGKTLAGASSASGDTITFSYDMDGQRSRKVVNGVTHQYLMQGTNVVYDACNGHCLEFIYDNVGQPYGFYYDGTPYYYVINQQGDVEKILNSQGSELVTYIYNAWGKPISIQDTSPNQIGSINPIRYRGYYYDSETGLYYVSSRYYDPEIGRFISPDTIDVLTATPMGLTDKNLYAYCDNNPVVRVDCGGDFWETTFDVISLGASIVEVCVTPTDPWAWASLVGDAVDLIPFVTGVGEATRAVKTTIKVVDNTSDVVTSAKTIYRTADAASDIRKATGSYEILYKSGYNYIGKGGFKRAITSAMEKVAMYGDEVSSIMWKSAPNSRAAFIDEYLMQKRFGGVQSNKKSLLTYNKIWSPGRRYYGD
ncbi:MAG: hypothetical protein PUB22_04200, partial [Clostridiales bacterium]|nr:hypothetical protein [Clostridiales bacterium]